MSISLYNFPLPLLYYRCFVGVDDDMTVEDCIIRDRKNPVLDPHQTSRSVSEMKEWVCSKMAKPDGKIYRDCLRLYTGGEAFQVCYSSIADGSSCLCSSELCNGSPSPTHRQFTSLTCQNFIRSSSGLICCIILVLVSNDYHHTILAGNQFLLSAKTNKCLRSRLKCRHS